MIPQKERIKGKPFEKENLLGKSLHLIHERHWGEVKGSES